jgi:hypothetical protein
MWRRYVRKSDEGSTRVSAAKRDVQALQESHCSVSAASTENRPGVGVGQGASQLSESARVVAGQIPVLLKNRCIIFELIALTNNGEPRLEGGAIKRAGGCNDGDWIAGAQCARLMKNRLRRERMPRV